MEAADEFVESMAWLSYLDEVDEAARTSFAGYKKRWEARREAGLIGKPHPPKSRHHTHDVAEDGMLMPGRVRSHIITSASSSEELTSSRVPYVPRIFEVKPRKVENRMYGLGNVRKNTRGVHGHRVLIQQPRKQY